MNKNFLSFILFRFIALHKLFYLNHKNYTFIFIVLFYIFIFFKIIWNYIIFLWLYEFLFIFANDFTKKNMPFGPLSCAMRICLPNPSPPIRFGSKNPQSSVCGGYDWCWKLNWSALKSASTAHPREHAIWKANRSWSPASPASLNEMHFDFRKEKASSNFLLS